jgi:hypothetical protein
MREILHALLTLVAAAVGGYLGTWLYIRTHRERPKALPSGDVAVVLAEITARMDALGTSNLAESGFLWRCHRTIEALRLELARRSSLSGKS